MNKCKLINNKNKEMTKEERKGKWEWLSSLDFQLQP